MKLIKQLIRILFLGFLAYHAYNSLFEIQKNSETFATSYKNMEESLKKLNINLPLSMQSKAVTENSSLILKSIDISIITLCILSLFTPLSIALIGIIFFLNSVVYHNYFVLNQSSDYEQFEPLCINLGVLGLSFMLACSSTSCTGAEQKCEKTESDKNSSNQKTTNSSIKRKKNVNRD